MECLFQTKNIIIKNLGDLIFNVHNYNFVKTNLKNNIFTSVIVNVLIGILFSFPVYSEQVNMEKYAYSNTESYNSEIQPESFTESYNFLYSSRCFNSHLLIDALPSKLYKTNLTTGNKKNLLNGYTLHFLEKPFRNFILSDLNQINSEHSNLSYLKELKTTKMLC